MEKSKLSFFYHLACDRVHDAIDDLYESLHNEDGEPILESDIINSSTEAVSNVVREELSIIKTALDEYAESTRG